MDKDNPINWSDEELYSKLADAGNVSLESKQLHQLEAQRRVTARLVDAVEKLGKSSARLELLTWTLLVIGTVSLGVLFDQVWAACR